MRRTIISASIRDPTFSAPLWYCDFSDAQRLVQRSSSDIRGAPSEPTGPTMTANGASRGSYPTPQVKTSFLNSSSQTVTLPYKNGNTETLTEPEVVSYHMCPFTRSPAASWRQTIPSWSKTHASWGLPRMSSVWAKVSTC